MIAFAQQVAGGSVAPCTDERDAVSSEQPLVFHPPGVIRVVGPAEEAATYRRAAQNGSRPSMQPMMARAAVALRRFARVWVEAQVHKGGI
jgi:hypothetical protein